MVRFKCTECNCDVINTKIKEEPIPLTVYLSPWVSMCTECEKKFFQSKQLGEKNETTNRPQSNQTI